MANPECDETWSDLMRMNREEAKDKKIKELKADLKESNRLCIVNYNMWQIEREELKQNQFEVIAIKGRVCTTTLGNVWCYYVNPQISGDWLAKYKDKDIKVYVEVLDEDK